MSHAGKKLGLLVSANPGQRNFQHALGLAAEALDRGLKVYLYCIDDAVFGVGDARLQRLKSRGLHLFACAYGAQQRNLPVNDLATFSGLGMVSDLMAATDRFVSFH